MSKLKIIFALLILMLTFSAVNAQTEDEPDDKPMNRNQILRELGLTDVQIRQFRMNNAESRKLLQAAQEKLRTAKRELDEAIYADTLDNAKIELKLRAFSAAQAEIARIRANTEVAQRNILTPEQLTRFREIRENFERRLKEMREKRQERSDKPTRRPQRRNRP